MVERVLVAKIPSPIERVRFCAHRQNVTTYSKEGICETIDVSVTSGQFHAPITGNPCGLPILFFACPKKRTKRKGSQAPETNPCSNLRNRRGKNSLRSNSLPLHPAPDLAARLSGNGLHSLRTAPFQKNETSTGFTSGRYHTLFEVTLCVEAYSCRVPVQ